MGTSNETKNPFHILSTKQIYKNPWIELVEHQVLNPRGKPGIYGVIKFQNRAVGVIPYEDGHVWMVGQYRFPLEKYSWEIPEGGSPAGEELVDTARRELKEETGLEAESYELIAQMHLSNSVSDEYAAVYLARGLKRGASSPEDTEELRVKKLRLEDVFAQVESGEITDSMTVAGIYKLMVLKLSGRL